MVQIFEHGRSQIIGTRVLPQGDNHASGVQEPQIVADELLIEEACILPTRQEQRQLSQPVHVV